ncbi:tape measure protein [Haemophilus influenzae]|uniref:tape measure protein n=1 Tax=Haemophilus influenzae TaxID=727 RepID=UPI000C338349|nr:tape measure protein [Haemophilus influenzae]PKF66385.1 phage tail tape measure protein [Haemophilus influenzae]
MAGTLGKLNIQLELDQVKFQNALSQAQQRTQKFSVEAQRYLNSIDSAMVSLNRSSKLTNLLLAKDIFARVGKAALSYADANTELINRLKLSTNGNNELAFATQSVFDISLRTNQAVSATSEVYQRFAKNADTLKISQKQVAELTETVSKAVAMSGASSASAEAALMQFGQAMASGELRGDELNSVMEQTPALAKAIADGLGVSVGALKDMGKNGELQISKVIEALQKVKSSVDSDFEKRVKTLSMSFTNLETSMIQFVGQVDTTYGVTQKLAEGVEFVAANLDSAIQAAVLFTGALAIGQIGKYSTALLQTGINSAKNTLSHYNEAKALYAKATASRIAAQAEMSALSAQLQVAQSEKTRFALREQMKAQAAQITALVNAEANAKRNLATANRLASAAAVGLRNVMGLLGGPAGVITIAASALYYFHSQAEEARKSAIDTKAANEQLKESYEGLSEAVLTTKIFEQIDAMKEQEAQLKSLGNAMIQSEFSNRRGWLFADTAEDVEKATANYRAGMEVATAKSKVFDNQLHAIVQTLQSKGRSLDEIKQKLSLFNVSNQKAEQIIADVKNGLDGAKTSTDEATGATIDFKKAQDELTKKSDDLRVKLEVLELKNKGHAKASYVLAGLYEVLGVKGAEYSKVLNAIANGDVVAAQSAATAINLSAEQLQTMLDMGKKIEGLFETDTKVTTIETNFKKNKSSENARENWLNFYDEIRKKSSSSLGEIELEQTRMFQRLEEHYKKGVVSYQEYETAKTAIAERFARQRLELAGKYAPEKLLLSNLKDDLAAIKELQDAGQLNSDEAKKAAQRVKFDYSQSVSQSAVDPLAQFRAQFDPNQEIENQRTRDLALLEAMQSGNEQKLLTEEEYQRRKKEIQDKYDLERQKKESDYYTQSTQMMSSAFDTMAGVMANAAGQQSAAYKAMFAVSKAFAIAESIINIQLALSEAAKLPYPQNLVEYARVASQTASIVSNIQSVTMSFATGGHVQGPGTGTSDSIPAWLSNNEFVMTSRTVDHYGVGFMNALNQRRLPKFANGGRVGGGGSSSYPGILSNHGGGDMNNDITITIHIDNNGNEETTTKQKAQQGKELSDLITVKVVEVLRKERRPGGLLA